MIPLRVEDDDEAPAFLCGPPADRNRPESRLGSANLIREPEP